MKFYCSLLAGWMFLVSVAGLSAQPFGLSHREGNSTLRLPPTAPGLGYATTNAFGALTFADPLVVTTPPGETNRLFVAEQNGVIAVITNLAAPNRTVFLDISTVVRGGVPTDEEGFLGFTFHPGYATNGYFFVYYSVNANTVAAGRHQRLSRFQVSPADPNQADAASEVPLLTMFDEAFNHNGGDLHFGPDGYLYVALGDEGGGNDQWNNSQIIDKDFWAGMLRLDVDNQPANLAPNPHPAINPGTYRVPADNPFVGVTTWHGSNLDPASVRTEFYAIGLRNPWRFSFDPGTGLLYLGDVGQGAREEIDVIRKGGNYGWAFREGFLAGPKAAPPGANPINPILDYGRGSGTNQGSSVSGGVVYRGQQIPALYGHYIFADYVSGNVWATRYDGTNASPFFRLTGDTGIAGFGIDPRNGDVLICDQSEDTIKRLISVPVSGPALPATLAAAGVFTNLTTLTPHAGIQPYDLNVPFWSDGAHKSRWFYVPTNRTITFRATNNWSFPTGTVWIKHFELELTNGVPSSRRRLETRLLVRDNLQGAYGITYRWGDSITDATLVPDGGMDEEFVINDGGTLRTQVWHYPGRSECLVCHTAPTIGGIALGFNTPQLNRDFDYSGIIDNQIRAFAHAGYFSQPVSNLNSLRALAHPTNESVSVEQRVRSYLSANCVQCHQPGGTGLGTFDTRLFTPLSAARIVNGTLANDGGVAGARVVAPGSAANSMLLSRISTRGPGQMPPLSSSVLDTQAIALVSRWIREDLASYQDFPTWQLANFGSTNAPNALAGADPDGDGVINYAEYLTHTNPNGPGDAWTLGIEQGTNSAALTYPLVPNLGVTLQSADLLANPVPWLFLDVPDNRPFFSATGGVMRVPIPATNAPARLYRALLYEP